MKRDLSFLISRSNGKPFNFKLSLLSFRFAITGLVALLILFFVSLAVNVFLLNHYQASKHQVTHSKEQQEVIEVLYNEVESLKKMMEELIQKEEEIRQDLGRPKYRKLSNRRRINRKKDLFNKGYPDDSFLLDTYALSGQLMYLKDQVVKIEKSMRVHSKVFKQYLAWFDETPSIWPVYGYIRSGYGWRTHPLKRVRQFHKGIDIPAWVGAPVQATADGFVEFSGWGGGYGWMVVLSHQYGIKTFYAHLSEIEVTRGVRVNKGQIIGKIGTSGLSTGPHVHYEIRQRRKALEPTKYLNLDLFTAVSKLW